MLFLRLLLPLLIIFLVAIVILRIYRFAKKGINSTRTKTPRPQPRLTTIFDSASPQLAAVTMMIGIARETGSITEKEREAIFAIMEEMFQQREEKAEELYYKSMELYAKANNLDHLFSSLSPVINQNCSYIEKKQFYEMLQNVASAETQSPAEKQKTALRQLEEYLNIGAGNVHVPPV